MRHSIAEWAAILGLKLRPVRLFIVLLLSRPRRVTFIPGMIIALMGEALRVWAIGHLRKDQTLTTTGPYRYCRHPCYLGNIIGALGTAAMANRRAVSVLLTIYLLVTYPPTIKLEERHLYLLFDEDYRRYRARVPALVPRLDLYRRKAESGTQSYTLAHLVIYRETHVLAALFVMVGGLTLKLRRTPARLQRLN